jgi:hypothetical protein
VSVGTSIVPPGPRPSLADTPGPSTAVTTSQATASLHDFAGSLAGVRVLILERDYCGYPVFILIHIPSIGLS